MSTLYLMRHGQTLFNLRHKIQGWCDSPLTELGIQQAQMAADYFRSHGITFDHAYSSTSERACDTLEIVTNMPYTRLKGLKEWNFGVFEAESEDLNPKLPYRDFFKAYGGDGEMELRQRMAETLEAVMSQENHRSVLAVSHGAACVAFSNYWKKTQKSKFEHGFKNCGIMHFDYQDGVFSLLEVIDPKDPDHPV